MTPQDFSAWLDLVRVKHGWNAKTALARLGAGKNQGTRWADPNGRGPDLTVALACAALACDEPLSPFTAPTTDERNAMDFDDQAAVMRLLRGAKATAEALAPTLLPEPLRFTMVRHDTGCHAWIKLSATDLPDITVWQGSIWVSSDYAHNDRGALLGFNPEAAFAHDRVRAFFAAVLETQASVSATSVLDRAQRTLAGERAHGEALAAYAERLG